MHLKVEGYMAREKRLRRARVMRVVRALFIVALVAVAVACFLAAGHLDYIATQQLGY